jgi:hypothetical protein
MQRYLIYTIVFVLLSSCTIIPSGPGIHPTGSVDVQATAVRKDNKSLAEGATVTFQRSGGLAGKTEQWTIYLDGRVLSNKGTAHVLPGDVAQLVADLSSLGIFNLKDSYGGLNVCKDCFTYTISISVDNKTKTITTTDGAPNTPAELGKILTLINDFINKIPQQ